MFSQLRLKQDYDLRMKSKKAAGAQRPCCRGGASVGSWREYGRPDKVFPYYERHEDFTGKKHDVCAAERHADGRYGYAGFFNRIKNNRGAQAVYADILIPASLDVDGIHGLQDRLMAGANVVTSIIPPRKGLAGVANAVQDIDEGFRTVAGVEKVLRDCGLRCASTEEYREWIDSRKKMIKE